MKNHLDNMLTKNKIKWSKLSLQVFQRVGGLIPSIFRGNFYFFKKFVTNLYNRSLIVNKEVRWWMSLTEYMLNIFQKYINL